MTPTRTTVCIVGAGFSGLGMAVRLDQAGIRDWVLLERAQAVGGTWRDNRYPGAACDIPSHLYSFSFELEPRWTRVYSPQGEIQAYLERVATDYGLRDRLRLGAAVTECRFDADRALWRVQAADGQVVEADFLVHGVGSLRDPRWPDIPGLQDFAGPVLHSSRWDPDLDLAGKRVGVVGTGASAIQIVPRLAEQAEQLTVYQRTPPWILPRADRAYSPAQRRAFATLPGLMRLYRGLLYLRQEVRYPLVFRKRTVVARLGEQLGRRHLRAQVSDPELRRALTPDTAIGCKRVLLSDDYYPAFARPSVQLETRRIQRVTAQGVVLDDGRQQVLDVLVCATGFTVDRPLGDMKVVGLDGRDLATWWGARPRAWLGITVPGFPRAFALLGPNTGLGHNSVVIMIEAQIRYVIDAIRQQLDRPDPAWLDLDEAALDAFLAQLDHRHASQVWASGCDSWYLGEQAVNFTIWPGSTVEYILRTRRFDPHPYRPKSRT